MIAPPSAIAAACFTIGRYMMNRVKWRLATLLEALQHMLIGWVEENWG